MKNVTSIGIGSSVRENIKVDERVVIGGSSFVNKNCEKLLYFGVPIKKIRANKKINMTFIIAEVGVNHNGDLNKSKIIDFCMNNKIDAVNSNFQAKDLALKKTQKVKYQKNNAKDNENHYQMLKRLNYHRKIIKF